MPRPRNRHPSVKITVTATPMVEQYLKDIVRTELYGATPSEVAKTFVLRGIEGLIRDRIIDRQSGPVE